MKTYLTSDGIVVSGRTAREVLKALRAASREPEPSLEAFMTATATRVFRQTGRKLPTNSQARFVHLLVEVGLLKEKPDDQESQAQRDHGIQGGDV